MRRSLGVLLAIFICFIPSIASNIIDGKWERSSPLVIGHRGAPSYQMEETLLSYSVAYNQQASFLEIDLCVTKDGFLICRHECDLSETTDIASREEFSNKKRKSAFSTKESDGWFSEDFTLEEIRTLRTIERLPSDIRTHDFDLLYSILTIDEFLQFVRGMEAQGRISCSLDEAAGMKNRSVGVYIETKTPSYFRELGYDVEGSLLDTLERWGYKEICERSYASFQDVDSWISECKVILQSFENNLATQLPENCPYPRIQLISSNVTELQEDTGIPYSDLITKEGLESIKQWAVGVGPAKELLYDYNTQNSTQLLDLMHSVGLLVHPYTFRPESVFQNEIFSSPVDEINMFLEMGIDGFFTDSPDIGVISVNNFVMSSSVGSEGEVSEQPIWAEYLEYAFYFLTAFVLLGFCLCLLLLFVAKRVSGKKSSSQQIFDEYE